MVLVVSTKTFGFRPGCAPAACRASEQPADVKKIAGVTTDRNQPGDDRGRSEESAGRSRRRRRLAGSCPRPAAGRGRDRSSSPPDAAARLTERAARRQIAGEVLRARVVGEVDDSVPEAHVGASLLESKGIKLSGCLPGSPRQVSRPSAPRRHVARRRAGAEALRLRRPAETPGSPSEPAPWERAP